jgi:hypothetical protein
MSSPEASCLDGDDVRHRLALVGALVLARGAQAQRHLHVRLVGGVRVVLRALGELLGDDELVHRHRARHEVFAALAQGLVDVLHDVLRRPAGEDQVQRAVALRLGDERPVAAHDIEAFLLHHGGDLAVHAVLHLERRVLLLLQEQHRLVHAVNLNLQQAVPLVHLLLHRRSDGHHLLQVVAVGVDHDGVRVAVHHVQTERALRQIHGALQNLAALQRGELGERLGVEARRRETRGSRTSSWR